MSNRTVRIILIILMMVNIFLLYIPNILYLLWAKPRNGAGARLILWILTWIPLVSIFACIGLLLIEFKVINVDSRR